MAYIDKEKAIDKILSLKTSGAFTEDFKNEVLKAFEQEPSADVVEVRHGKWEKQQFIGRSGFFSVKDFTCSNCFENFAVEQGKGLMNYCPNCGAKMDGKDGE